MMMMMMMVILLNIEGGRTVSWVYIKRAAAIKLTYEGNACENHAKKMVKQT